MAKKKRNFKKEYADFHGKAEQKKNRAKRNGARRTLAKEGKVSKGDGKDVDHKNPLSKGGGNGRSNLRVQPKGVNRARNMKKKIKK